MLHTPLPVVLQRLGLPMQNDKSVECQDGKVVAETGASKPELIDK